MADTDKKIFNKRSETKNSKENKDNVIILVGIIIAIAILAGTSGGNLNIIQNFFNDTIWQINSTTGDIEPINISENRTVRVFELVVISPGSVFIGGLNGSRISSQSVFLSTINQTRLLTTVNTGLIADAAFNGTQFFSNVQRDFNQNSNAVTGTSDPEGNGNVLIKFNKNYTQPYLNQLIGLYGDYQLMTTFNNSASLSGLNTTNEINFGFYSDVNVTQNFSIINMNNPEFVLTIKRTNITSIQPHIFENTTYLNQSWVGSPMAARTSPDTVVDKIALFARDDNNLYIKRSTGEIKRVSVVGSGSSVFSEEVKFNNHTQFFGDVILNNTVYNGGYVGYACIGKNGAVFKSAIACPLVAYNHIKSTIANSSMGEEIDTS